MVNFCVQHFDLYKLPKSNLTNVNILCLVRFGSDQVSDLVPEQRQRNHTIINYNGLAFTAVAFMHSLKPGRGRIISKKLKSFPSHMGPWGGADLRFYSPQLDTSLHCEAMDMGLVYHTACLFTPQLSPVPYQVILLGDRHTQV